MRLINRNRQHQAKVPRIAISEAEITADLLYPASRRPAPAPSARRPRGERR